MQTVDAINNKFSKSTVSSGLVGTRINEWELIKKNGVPVIPQKWNELLTIE